MSFSQSTIDEVRRKADFTCCWCRSRQEVIEIHHIVPQSESGSDGIDNAAPLCPSCHSKYGNNPDLRKQLRERRDRLYETVLAPSPSLSRMEALIEKALQSPNEGIWQWSKTHIYRNEVWIKEDNAIYQIEIDYSYDGEAFSESWTKHFPDPESYVHIVNLRINATIIRQYRFIALDGGRVFVPTPYPQSNPDSQGVSYYWRRDSVEFKIASLIREFYIYKNMDEISRITKVAIR